jgi:hypothetical protein
MIDAGIQFPYESQCLPKQKIATEARAIEAAHRLARKCPDEIFTVYLCGYCKKFHVGRVRIKNNTPLSEVI